MTISIQNECHITHAKKVNCGISLTFLLVILEIASFD